jgi:3-hydroxyacyl-CoA dehydrogenase
MTDITAELKALEARQADLEKQKAALLQKQQEMEERKARLGALVEQSGFGNAKALVEALIENYGLKISKATKTSSSGRKPRQTVTAAIRDAFRADLASGLNRSQAAKKNNVSYAVAIKIEKGGYDHL